MYVWEPLPTARPFSVSGKILTRPIFQLVGFLQNSQSYSSFSFDLKFSSGHSRFQPGSEAAVLTREGMLPGLPNYKLMKQFEIALFPSSNCMSSVVACVQETLKYKFPASIAFLKFSISEYVVALDGFLDSQI